VKPLPTSTEHARGSDRLIDASARGAANGNGAHETEHADPHEFGAEHSANGNGNGGGVADRNGRTNGNGSAVSEPNENGNASVVVEPNGHASRGAYSARRNRSRADWPREERRGGGTGGRRGNISAIRVSVVIPALNEALNLRHVLANLPDNLFEVVLVPGSSTDDTEIVARTLRPDIRVIHQTRSGKGNALACGFAACRGDIIVTLDADGSADPKEIPAFVGALLAGADFAKGTRAIQGGGSHDMTPLRRLGNHALTRLANVLHGTHYSDLCYGYNAFWHACLPALNVDIDGFEIETLLNLRAAKSGLRVAEVASFELARIHGHSNLRTFSDGWRVLGTILREWIPKYRRIPHTPPSRLQAGRRRAARRAGGGAAVSGVDAPRATDAPGLAASAALTSVPPRRD